MRVRFGILAWNWGVGEFESVLLPSLLQPANVPWLIHNGYELALTVYTVESDAPRIRDILGAALAPLSPPPGSLSVNLALSSRADQPDTPNLKRIAFLTECRQGIAERCPVMLMGSDCFFGNGSIRNITTYCRKPDVVAAGIYLRVDRDAFMELLQRYRAAFGAEPLSNAKLVDMGWQTQIEALRCSNVDSDRNASFSTAVSTRVIAPDLIAMVHHLPSPFMFWPQQSDIDFFEFYGGGAFESLDRAWPTQLIGQRRWRLLASSDLFFLVELTPGDVAERIHSFAAEDGMLYNERYYYDLPNMHMHEQIVITLRREPFLSP